MFVLILLIKYMINLTLYHKKCLSLLTLFQHDNYNCLLSNTIKTIQT